MGATGGSIAAINQLQLERSPVVLDTITDQEYPVGKLPSPRWNEIRNRPEKV
jgi:hypothetical protein